MKRFYIAGRIANEPNYREKFAAAVEEVRALGHVPVNPCELHEHCSHSLWEEWMVCDIHAMIDCDGVYALRDHANSPGATVEIDLAIVLKKEIIYQ